MAKVRRFYLVVGRGAGGVAGVLVFLAAWVFCIAEFGLVFGVALGWIPAALTAMAVSVLITWAWAPLVLAALVVISAPAWDKAGHVRRATGKSAAAGVGYARIAVAKTHAAALWARDQARREGLL